jgi:hypothetical protein
MYVWGSLAADLKGGAVSAAAAAAVAAALLLLLLLDACWAGPDWAALGRDDGLICYCWRRC